MLGVPSLIKAGRFPVAHQFSCRFHLMRKDKIKAVIVERQTKAERRRKLSIAQMKRRHRERAEKARKGL
jgi:hypothetical protein